MINGLHQYSTEALIKELEKRGYDCEWRPSSYSLEDVRNTNFNASHLSESDRLKFHIDRQRYFGQAPLLKQNT